MALGLEESKSSLSTTATAEYSSCNSTPRQTLVVAQDFIIKAPRMCGD